MNTQVTLGHASPEDDAVATLVLQGGVVVSANAAARGLLDPVRRLPCEGRDWRTLLVPDDPAGAGPARPVPDLPAVARRTPMHTVGGAPVWVLASPGPPTPGGEASPSSLLVQVRPRSRPSVQEVAAVLPHSSLVVLDQDLRVEVAGGELLQASGFDLDAMRGRLLGDLFPDLDKLEGFYQQAAAGRGSDFTFHSAMLDRVFRLRLRPRRRTGSEPRGVIALVEDVASCAARAERLTAPMAHTAHGWFDQATGWTFDRAMIEMWGLDPQRPDRVEDLEAALVPDDRAGAVAGWQRVLGAGGELDTSYRLRDTRTDASRTVRAHWWAQVDAHGALARAVVTHQDLDAPLAEPVPGQAPPARSTTLLGQVGAAPSAPPATGVDTLQRLCDLAARAVGSRAALYLLEPGTGRVLTRVVACGDPDGLPPWERALGRLEQDWETGPLGKVQRSGRLLSTLGRPQEGDALGPVADGDGSRAQFVLASGRHDRSGPALLLVARAAAAPPYTTTDLDLVQALAERVALAAALDGTAAASARAEAERTATTARIDRLVGERADLLEQLARTEARERTLIAEAVHDDPLQQITVAMMRVEHLRTSPAGPDQASLGAVLDSLEQAVTSLRTLVTALAPPDLDDGLGPALLQLAQGIFVGTRTTVEISGPSQVRLGPETAAIAHRIIREALVNTRKHADATAVVLTLREDASRVVITSSDDGVGAATLAAAPGHLGLATMRARAEAAGAELGIDSRPGSGTRVKLTLPIRQ